MNIEGFSLKYNFRNFNNATITVLTETHHWEASFNDTRVAVAGAWSGCRSRSTKSGLPLLKTVYQYYFTLDCLYNFALGVWTKSCRNGLQEPEQRAGPTLRTCWAV